MRILFLSREYPPDTAWGGIGSYLAIMAPALAARGHEVHVLSCVEGQERKDYVEQGVHVHLRREMTIRPLWWMNRIVRKPKTILRFRRGIATFIEYLRLGLDFDVIEYPDWGAMGWVFGLLHRQPLVAHLHTPPLLSGHHPLSMSRDLRWAYSLVYSSIRHADVVTAPSKFLVRELNGAEWLRGIHVEVLPLPIQWRHWAGAQPVADTPPVVLFLGRLEQLKAPELLVEAISIIRKTISSAKAVFAGASSEHRDGLPYIDWLKSTIGDTSGCEFLGPVPRHKLIDLLSFTRVLALPSWYENFSVSALEVMAAGRPVVVSARSGTADLVRDAEAGSVVPPGDSKSLAQSLEPFLRDTGYAALVGDKARTAIRQWLDPDRVAAQREMVYQQAAVSFRQRGGDVERPGTAGR